MIGCLNATDVSCVPSPQAAWWNAASGRHLFPALYLQNAQSGDLTPAEAIIQIQQMAAGWAQSWDAWTSFTAHPEWPTLVWCPQRDCEFPPDTAFPLLHADGVPAEWYFSIGIVSAHLPADPPAGDTQVICPAGDCWSVLLH